MGFCINGALTVKKYFQQSIRRINYMKSSYFFNCPDEILLISVAAGIIWDWKVGLFSYLALVLIYIIGRGK